MALEILAFVFILVGIYFSVEPDNFLLSFLAFGDHAISISKRYGKEAAIRWIRISGIFLIIFGIISLLATFKII
jgi:hypothetical protein